jgi:hypothetical protein
MPVTTGGKKLLLMITKVYYIASYLIILLGVVLSALPSPLKILILTCFILLAQE